MTIDTAIKVYPATLRFKEAYLRMAKEARYRPGAPGDGMGHVDLSPAQLKDSARLDDAALRYAAKFRAEEDSRKFWIGCSEFATNRAFMFTIEAARALAGNHRALALDLLKLAIDDVKEFRR